MNRASRIFNIFISSPQTWLVFIITFLMCGGYLWWFGPPVFLSAAGIGAAVFLIFLWIFIFIKSDIFRVKYNMGPDAVSTDDLEDILRLCHPSFRQPAMECIALAKTIRKEFKEQGFSGEVDSVLQNLTDLAKNHAELFERSKKFGTPSQKKTMARLLQTQIDSVENSLVALKQFSGNLTLFDLHLHDQKDIDNELEAINMGLQEAIKEIENA